MAPRISVITGFLHPGAMGSSIASACEGSRLWAGSGRSSATAQRAMGAGLENVATVDALTSAADTVVCICPPAAALDVAQQVADLEFDGTYVDANAVSPTTSRQIAELFEHFVDGGIIGPPVANAGTTRMYLSGERAAQTASRWADSALEVRLVEGGPGAASAVKLGFAAWTKGTSALLLAIRAFAEAEGVAADLSREWATSMPDLLERAEHTAPGVGPKAWRFAGEMSEIADSLATVGLPDGFHRAAADLYESLSEFKDASPGPSLDDVIAALLR